MVPARRAPTLPLAAAVVAASLCGSAAAQAPTWLPVLQITPRSTALAFDSARGQTVMFGGQTDQFLLTDETWEWDGVRWRHRDTQGGPQARFGHTMAYDAARGRVVLFGGADSAAILADTWTYDGDRWQQLTPAISPPARYTHAMTYDSARARVLVHGGSPGGGTPAGFLTDTWEWDGSAWQLVAAAGPGTGVGHLLAYDAARQRAVLFRATTAGQPGETWLYDTVAWQQQFPAHTPLSRIAPALVYDAVRQRVVLFGGASNGAQSDTWEWDGVDWQLAPSGPPARAVPSLAFDSRRGRVVLAGGSGQVQPTSTWERAGTSWALADVPATPGARQRHAAGADEARGVVVVYGGNNTTSQVGLGGLADTWIWDGHAWSQRSVTGPGVLDNARLAWDAVRQELVTLGGSPFGTGETWSWNGTAWSNLVPATSPPYRHSYALACDHARNRVLLFGGSPTSVFTPGLAPLGDTWLWDGTNWTQQAVPSPIPRRRHAMAEDPLRQRIVMYGGETGAGTLADTWEWTGTAWQSVAASGPGARAGHAMAYDGARQRVVLVGGDFISLQPWEWNGIAWTAPAIASNPEFLADLSLVREPVLDRLFAYGGTHNGVRGQGWLLGQIAAAAAQTIGTPCPDPARPILTSNASRFFEPALTFELIGAPPASPCAFGWSVVNQPAPVGPCTVHLGAPVFLEFALTDAAGVAHSAPLAVPPVAVFRGLPVFVQAAVVDPAGPLGLGFSALRQLTIGD